MQVLLPIYPWPIAYAFELPGLASMLLKVVYLSISSDPCFSISVLPFQSICVLTKPAIKHDLLKYYKQSQSQGF